MDPVRVNNPREIFEADANNINEGLFQNFDGNRSNLTSIFLFVLQIPSIVVSQL